VFGSTHDKRRMGRPVLLEIAEDSLQLVGRSLLMRACAVRMALAPLSSANDLHALTVGSCFNTPRTSFNEPLNLLLNVPVKARGGGSLVLLGTLLWGRFR
jgi:hypothetical protein